MSKTGFDPSLADIKGPNDMNGDAGSRSLRGALCSPLNWAGVALALSMVPNAALAQEQVAESILYSFTNGSNGFGPEAPLVQGTDGNFYGTTDDGGQKPGTVFKLTPAGVQTVIHNFDPTIDDAGPLAGLVQGSDGDFYGTTAPVGAQIGYGTVFKISPAGTFTNLHIFQQPFGTADGETPTGNLVQGSDGNFYGTTSYGGTNGLGTVFKVTPGGSLSVIYSFAGTPDGARPPSGLILGSDGNFYGTAQLGGTGCSTGMGCGTVFKITPAGVETTLYSFPTSGAFYSALVQGKDGNFYGTTTSGGAGNVGTIYKLSPSGQATVLYEFTGSPNGSYPAAGLIQGSDGNFYGTTTSGGAGGNGTVFALSLTGTQTLLYSFANMPDGGTPRAALVQGSDGNLYGTTAGGGIPQVGNTQYGNGTVFKITLPPQAPTALTATPGNAQAVLSWTAGTGATSYNVYQATTTGGEGATPVATGLTSPTATITGLANGTTYYFKVAAVNAAGVSGLSNEASAQPLAPPQPPTALTATPGNAQAVLSWTPGTGATSYNVYQATTAGGEGATPVATGLTSPTATITGLANGTTYYFKVAAVNAAGVSGLSNEASVQPLASPPASSGSGGGGAASPSMLAVLTSLLAIRRRRRKGK